MKTHLNKEWLEIGFLPADQIIFILFRLLQCALSSLLLLLWLVSKLTKSVMVFDYLAQQKQRKDKQFLLFILIKRKFGAVCIYYVPVAFSTSCFHRPENFEIVLITPLEIGPKLHFLSSK